MCEESISASATLGSSQAVWTIAQTIVLLCVQRLQMNSSDEGKSPAPFLHKAKMVLFISEKPMNKWWKKKVGEQQSSLSQPSPPSPPAKKEGYSAEIMRDAWKKIGLGEDYCAEREWGISITASWIDCTLTTTLRTHILNWLSLWSLRAYLLLKDLSVQQLMFSLDCPKPCLHWLFTIKKGLNQILNLALPTTILKHCEEIALFITLYIYIVPFYVILKYCSLYVILKNSKCTLLHSDNWNLYQMLFNHILFTQKSITHHLVKSNSLYLSS